LRLASEGESRFVSIVARSCVGIEALRAQLSHAYLRYWSEVGIHVLLDLHGEQLADFLRKAFHIAEVYCSLKWVRILIYHYFAKNPSAEINFDLKWRLLRDLDIVHLDVFEDLRHGHL